MTSVRHTTRRVRGDGACWLPPVGCLAQMCSRWAESLIGGSRGVRCAMRCRRRFARRPGRPPPSTPGLYRLRRVGRTELDYIGQTGSGGMTLRKRARMLASIHGEVMPF